MPDFCYLETCCICTRLTECIELGTRWYCKACVMDRMYDPDGKTEFLKIMEKAGVIDIETD